MYRKGYFMSHEDERAAKGDLFLEFEEARHRIGLLKAQADKIAAKLESLATVKQPKPRQGVSHHEFSKTGLGHLIK